MMNKISIENLRTELKTDLKSGEFENECCLRDKIELLDLILFEEVE